MGTLCKRIKRHRRHYLATWRRKVRRWPKGLRAMTARRHYIPTPQHHMPRPPGSAQIAYQGYYTITYAHGGQDRRPR
jgi:hypothetical protein